MALPSDAKGRLAIEWANIKYNKQFAALAKNKT